MYFLKKKKNKILTIALVASLAASVSFGSVLYYSFSDNHISFDTSSNGITDAELAPINNAINDAIVSNRDNKLKPSEEKIIKETEKKIEEKIIIPPAKKEEKIEAAKPIPKPVVRKPETKITSPKITRRKQTITIAGIEVEAEIEGPPGFVTHQRDKDRKISNPTKPYQNHTVNKILSVKVTDKLKEQVAKDALSGGNGYDEGVGLFNNSIFNVFKEEFNSGKELNDILSSLESVARQNSGAFQNTLERYKKMLDSNNVINFLKSEAQKEYPKLKSKFQTKNQEYIWLIANLDQSKFTKIASTSEKYLEKGLTISPRSAFINEAGEIDSNGWGPPDEYNTVTSRLRRDNSEYRVFDYDEYYSRSSDRIANGTYPGWVKEDVSEPYSKKYNFKASDGIRFSKLERINPNPAKGKLNSGLVLDLDVSNDEAYRRSKELIEKLQKDGEQITSYRIKNMGEKNSDQAFKDILGALPKDIQQLELFFSDKATNTASLIALENKNIKELSLYTSGNSLKKAWSYNPLALRNTTWINTIDYNVSAEYSSHDKITTRITFNTLAFDQEDFSNGSYERINDGLRMVYYARNNEPFFQGGHGPGLEPDKKLGQNSYPTGLDFSRVTGIKSLKGLRFDDDLDTSNEPRKITELTLYNNESYFEISSDELNEANLQHLSTGEGNPEKPKIHFSNGNNTTSIRISGKTLLSDEGRRNLDKYFEYNESLRNSGKQIQIPNGSDELKKQLEGWGYKVSTASDRSFT
ncbi:mycoplasma virulence signal region (Myco_arth_vir_N) family [synthetic Mycoplasma mycoides JCVI-syn1.0]|uniref:putative immunoglobulin-blocking virulence protein n=1 Tax=Mycoplasma mycoides TaxID=2102 RepID=UPI0001793D5E|nr:putative immunoglobulin-blocking virulence protein [Mycoplasma mycoides]ADH22071.1 mycoplasma virulence signal region (Myco_arth_vir_N) family [synthetic Mycoplasma mycoides JCVI-syn1.0]ACU78312.1 mycoplasma virulence signal region (Myco_arth_vir_N) family [Mycoplasma mycoides subsp. capri str. GM12]ACU79142.1 mycoplasma virulence signal region (Myco_arth_vir_N) family [Mycoplasma mycoides subsp. capri str. GM12]SRX63299.1 putative immunoglobulin-blocking virulence protein [Mycoplasma mycoid